MATDRHPIASRLLRPSWLEIDLDAPAENLRSVRRLVGADRKIFAEGDMGPGRYEESVISLAA